jgi:hypothetical protein
MASNRATTKMIANGLWFDRGMQPSFDLPGEGVFDKTST